MHCRPSFRAVAEGETSCCGRGDSSDGHAAACAFESCWSGSRRGRWLRSARCPPHTRRSSSQAPMRSRPRDQRVRGLEWLQLWRCGLRPDGTNRRGQRLDQRHDARVRAIVEPGGQVRAVCRGRADRGRPSRRPRAWRAGSGQSLWSGRSATARRREPVWRAGDDACGVRRAATAAACRREPDGVAAAGALHVGASGQCRQQPLGVQAGDRRRVRANGAGRSRPTAGSGSSRRTRRLQRGGAHPGADWLDAVSRAIRLSAAAADVGQRELLHRRAQHRQRQGERRPAAQLARRRDGDPPARPWPDPARRLQPRRGDDDWRRLHQSRRQPFNRRGADDESRGSYETKSSMVGAGRLHDSGVERMRREAARAAAAYHPDRRRGGHR